MGKVIAVPYPLIIDRLVDEIRGCLETIHDQRLEASIKIARLRDEVVKAGHDWHGWLADNRDRFTVGDRDIRRLLKIGSSSNPAAALEAVREKTREAVADLRKSGKKGPTKQRLKPKKKAKPKTPKPKRITKAEQALLDEKKAQDEMRAAVRAMLTRADLEYRALQDAWFAARPEVRDRWLDETEADFAGSRALAAKIRSGEEPPTP